LYFFNGDDSVIMDSWKCGCICVAQQIYVNDSYNKAVACRRWCWQTNSVSSGRQSPRGSASFGAALYSRLCRQCYIAAWCVRTAIWTRCPGV